MREPSLLFRYLAVKKFSSLLLVLFSCLMHGSSCHFTMDTLCNKFYMLVQFSSLAETVNDCLFSIIACVIVTLCTLVLHDCIRRVILLWLCLLCIPCFYYAVLLCIAITFYRVIPMCCDMFDLTDLCIAIIFIT